MSLILEQELELRLDGQPMDVRSNEELLEMLGWYFQLRVVDDYVCGVQISIEYSVETDFGEARGELVQALMPAGCALLVPESSPKPTAPTS